MPTLRERFTDLLLGDQRRKLEESAQLLYNAYLEGPFVLPPDQLLAQLKEQDAALLTDLVHQLYWEHLGTPGYSLDLTAERGRAIDESRRLWKYNPLAQWMIWLWTNYGFGENIVITPEDESAVEVWEEFWKADRNQIVLAQDRIADRLSNWLLVDGDRFLAFYASTLDGEATVRRINTKEVVEIVTDPDDSSVPLFYKRQWTNTKSQQLTWYYPDWEAFFRGDLDRAELPQGAIRADEQNTGTTVCILHISFNGKDEDSLYGWPLLAAGSPWIRSQKRHLENRLAVSAAKAMYVRRAKVSGGSRAVNAVISNIQSALSSTQGYETNPPAVAGSTLVENQAVDTTDLPMTTGASDAKTDGEMFSWMAGLSGGVFPHYMGLGDAYRLATATSMEKPLEMQFSRYQVFWGAQFRKKVRIVLQFKEKYGDATYQTYEAEVSTDKMVEVDLDGMSQALGKVFTTIINPQAELRMLPAEVTQGMLKASLKTILQALGVDAEAVVGDEVWEGEEEQEEEIEEGGKGSGWFAPPKGTHGKGRRRRTILATSAYKITRDKFGQRSGYWRGRFDEGSNYAATSPEAAELYRQRALIQAGHHHTEDLGIVEPVLYEPQNELDLALIGPYTTPTVLAIELQAHGINIPELERPYGFEAFAKALGLKTHEASEFSETWRYFENPEVVKRIQSAGFDAIRFIDRERGQAHDAVFLLKGKLLSHEDLVRKALQDGKSVPEKVLKDYPDLRQHVKENITNDAKNSKLLYHDEFDVENFQPDTVIGQWLLGEGELEESIALALQNYRSGLIDADDLVAFLLPAKLEEGGPHGHSHKGSWGCPGGVGFPGGVQVTYERRLSGAILVSIEGVLKAAPRYSGLQLKNTNPRYGEEMPDKVKTQIARAVDSRYAPKATAALAAKEAGDPDWRKLRKESKDILAQIANEAKEAWKEERAKVEEDAGDTSQ